MQDGPDGADEHLAFVGEKLLVTGWKLASCHQDSPGNGRWGGLPIVENAGAVLDRMAGGGAAGRQPAPSSATRGKIQCFQTMRPRESNLRNWPGHSRSWRILPRSFDAKVVGQARLRESLLVGLLTGGHILLESVPGLAKTTAAQTVAEAVSADFRRIQCTPDLLPSDIVGTQIYDAAKGTFVTQLGPVHANIVLLDEINRSSAKTQSAMLEAMQERQTSIGGRELPAALARSWSWPPRTPSSRRAPTCCPKPRWTASCSRTCWTTRTRPRKPRSSAGSIPGSSRRSSAGRRRVAGGGHREPRNWSGVSTSIPPIVKYIVGLVFVTRNAAPVHRFTAGGLHRVRRQPPGQHRLQPGRPCGGTAERQGPRIPEDVKTLAHRVLRHRLILTSTQWQNKCGWKR